MKKFTLILGITLIFFGKEAFSSDFNLRLFNNSSFFVEMDNQVYSNMTNSFTLTNLAPGNHYFVVYKNRNNGRGYNNLRMVLYSGYINLPFGMKVFGMIDNRNRFVVTSQVAIGNYGKNNYNHKNRNQNYNKREHGQNNYGYNDHNNNNGNRSMNQADFSNLIIMISNASFESTKLSIAKNALIYNSLSSAQVLEIMYLFSFESTKLDFAKQAYISVIDRERYFIVNNAFSFSSSIEELNRYIRGR